MNKLWVEIGLLVLAWGGIIVGLKNLPDGVREPIILIGCCIGVLGVVDKIVRNDRKIAMERLADDKIELLHQRITNLHAALGNNIEPILKELGKKR